jgi:glycosyl transferase family 2
VIVFASAIREPDDYAAHAQPGIERVAEPESPVHAYAAIGSVCRSYNLLLDQAGGHEDLEALVLVDQDLEITDREFCAKVRAALADPGVALVGCAGATGVQTAAWWDGAVISGDVTHRYSEYGGGDLDAYGWARSGRPPAAVDAVDGHLLVLSPWAARELRFDEDLHLGIGFEVDFAARVRQAGRKVLAADLAVVHHRGIDLVGDLDLWTEGHVELAEKWDGHLPGAPPRPDDWKARARLAEAEREAARAQAYSVFSRREAQLVPLERELTAMTETTGWRLTTPLRQLNALRRRARAGSQPSR